MNAANRIRRSAPWLMLAILSVLLAACGGGGSAVGSMPGGATGSVGIVVTDAPSAEFSAINLTIEGIDLIGDTQHVTLFDAATDGGAKTVNLLDLSNFSYLFAVSQSVPVGSYNKIRLYVSDIALVPQDTTAPVIHPQLPANGKIDLNPREPFTVVSGQPLYLQLDFDANKSIQIVTTGNGKYVFRPVVFVDVLGTNFTGKLVRIHGAVQSVASDGSSFLLCPIAAAATSGTAAPTTDWESEHCVTVLTADASVFDTHGDPAVLGDAVVPGAELTAIGFLKPTPEPATLTGSISGDQLEHVLLSGEVIEMGPLGTFSTVTGTVSQAPTDSLDGFALSTAGASTDTQAQLQNGTKIFSKTGQPLDYTAITLDRTASVDGVFSTTDPIVLKSALVVVDTGAQNLSLVSGTVTLVDIGAGTVTITTSTGDLVVSLLPDAHVFQLQSTSSGAFSTEIGLGDLQPGQRVDVYGTPGVTGYFNASTILAAPLSS